MSDLAILGAGDLGGALAHRLASRDRFRRIFLIDANGAAAAGKALDILQAAPIENVTTQVIGAALGQATHASVLVIADTFGPPSVEWQGDEGLRTLLEAAAVAPRAVVLCAGASQRDLVERAVREGGLPRNRVLGSAPTAFAAGAAAALALTLDTSAIDVRVPIVGALPEQPVVLWSAARAGTRAVTSMLSASDRARVATMLPYLWPPAPYALASAACHIAEALTSSARTEHLVWTCLDGEWDLRGEVAAVPVQLDAHGIAQVSVSGMDTGESDALARAMSGRTSAAR